MDQQNLSGGPKMAQEAELPQQSDQTKKKQRKWKHKNKRKREPALIINAIRHQNVGTKSIRKAAFLASSTKTARYKKQSKKRGQKCIEQNGAE